MISSLTQPRASLVSAWLVLVVLTLISFWFRDHGLGQDSATTVILALTFAKVFMVGYAFMEISHAPPLLRRIFAAWCGGTCLVLIALALGLS